MHPKDVKIAKVLKENVNLLKDIIIFKSFFKIRIRSVKMPKMRGGGKGLLKTNLGNLEFKSTNIDKIKYLLI